MARPARALRPATAASNALSFQPLAPERWADAEALFGARGACGGCWCMWARLTSAEFARGKGEPNRRSFRRIVTGGGAPGILAYAGGAPVGWCAIAPRTEYRRLETSRVLSPVDDRPVWSVVCFFIARSHRGRGLTVRLLREAVRFARARGAAIVEGYPVEPGSRSADAFVWTGLASAFRRAGFVEVARRSPTRPIMRKVLRRTAPGKATVPRRTTAARRG
jgi:GNAT superfamily N-acetyltransferase